MTDEDRQLRSESDPATFCGSRSAGYRTRAPGGTGQLVTVPRSPVDVLRFKERVAPQREQSKAGAIPSRKYQVGNL
jgi:hypothetical protein